MFLSSLWTPGSEKLKNTAWTWRTIFVLSTTVDIEIFTGGKYACVYMKISRNLSFDFRWLEPRSLDQNSRGTYVCLFCRLRFQIQSSISWYVSTLVTLDLHKSRHSKRRWFVFVAKFRFALTMSGSFCCSLSAVSQLFTPWAFHTIHPNSPRDPTMACGFMLGRTIQKFYHPFLSCISEVLLLLEY